MQQIGRFDEGARRKTPPALNLQFAPTTVPSEQHKTVMQLLKPTPPKRSFESTADATIEPAPAAIEEPATTAAIDDVDVDGLLAAAINSVDGDMDVGAALPPA